MVLKGFARNNGPITYFSNLMVDEKPSARIVPVRGTVSRIVSNSPFQICMDVPFLIVNALVPLVL